MITEDIREILDNLYDGVYIIDKERQIHYWNKAAEELTGYTNLDLVGSYCFSNILSHVDSDGNILCNNGCPMLKAIKENKIVESEVFFHHRDGHLIPTLIKIIPYKNKDGETIGAIEIFSENSERNNILKKIKELEKLAVLDELTQIPNRRYLENIIKMKLNDFLLNQVKFGLVFMDIDFFKKFNDNYGHDVGDLVLKTISTTFSNNLRGDDIIGRWGGEEFIGIFSGIDENSLKKITEKLRMLVENTTIKAKTQDLKVTISCGATLVTNEDDVNTLIKRSDELLYKSKKSGRNCVCIG